MDRKKSLLKNTVILGFGTFLPKFSSIITLPIITAGLSKTEMGTYDLINTLVSLFLPIATLQIQAAAFRYLIDCRNNKEETKCIISNIIGFIMPSSIIALFILFFCLSSNSTSIRLLICIYFFIDILMLSLQQIIRGLSNNKLYSISAVIIAMCNMLLLIGTVHFGKSGLFGVLCSITIANFVGFIFILIKGNVLQYLEIQLISRRNICRLLAYSWPMVPNSLSSWVLSVSDRMVITIFLGLEANAVYSVASKIPQLFSTVQSTFVFAWQENASLATKDEDATAYYSEMFDSIFRILVGLMALLIVSTPVLFFFLIKGDYADSYPQMPLLFIGMLFSSISAFLGGIYVAHKKTKSVGLTTMLAAGLNLIIDLLLVKQIGIYAASVSTLISYLFLSVYRMIDIQKFQIVKYNIRTITFSLAILCTLSSICWINQIYTNIFNLLFGIVFAAIINKKIVNNIICLMVKKIKRG